MYVLHLHKYIIDWGCEGVEWGCDTCDTVYPFSGNSLREFCLRKKIPELYHNVPDLCSEIRTEPRHGTMAHCTCFPETPYEKSVQKRDPGNGTQSAIVPGSNSGFWTKWTKGTVFPEKSSEKSVQKKDPGNHESFVHFVQTFRTLHLGPRTPHNRQIRAFFYNENIRRSTVSIRDFSFTASL